MTTVQEPTASGCTAHQCGECGRFVKASTVRHWTVRGAVGHCDQHKAGRVLCVRVGKRSTS